MLIDIGRCNSFYLILKYSTLLSTTTFLLSVVIGQSFGHSHLFPKVIFSFSTQSLTFVIEKYKIELFLFKIRTCNLDVDIIAKTISMIVSTTDKAMILLVKVIIVIGEITHWDEAFTQVIIKLDIQSPFRDTSPASKIVRPEVPFITGASSLTAARPIIGPPTTIFGDAGSVKGISLKGVPIAAI